MGNSSERHGPCNTTRNQKSKDPHLQFTVDRPMPPYLLLQPKPLCLGSLIITMPQSLEPRSVDIFCNWRSPHQQGVRIELKFALHSDPVLLIVMFSLTLRPDWDPGFGRLCCCFTRFGITEDGCRQSFITHEGGYADTNSSG